MPLAPPLGLASPRLDNDNDDVVHPASTNTLQQASTSVLPSVSSSSPASRRRALSHSSSHSLHHSASLPHSAEPRSQPPIYHHSSFDHPLTRSHLEPAFEPRNPALQRDQAPPALVSDRDGSLDLPASPFRTVPVQVIVSNSKPGASDSPSSSRSHGHHAADDDGDGAWEDEGDDDDDDDDDAAWGDDSLVSDSDASIDAADDDDAVRRQRTAYRDAVRQYRRSRKALLLSGLSSYASTPSPEQAHAHAHSNAHAVRSASEAPLYRSRSSTPQPSTPPSLYAHRIGDSDRYLSASNAEPIDAASPPGRAHEAVFEHHRTTRPPSSPQHASESASPPEPPGSSSSSSFEAPAGGRSQSNGSNGSGDKEDGQNGTAAHPQHGDEYASDHSSPLIAQSRSSTPDTAAFHEAPETGRLALAPLPELHPGPDAVQRGDGKAESHADELHGRANGGHAVPTAEQHEIEADAGGNVTATGEVADKATGHIDAAEPNSAPEAIDTGAAPAAGRPLTTPQPQPDPQAGLLPPQPEQLAPFSLWDYLQEEILATDFDSTQEMKWERVTNFIAIPFWMEKIIMFGFVVCLDSFLYTFTILPLRFGVALYRWTTNSARWALGGEKRYLHSSHKCDLLKGVLIALSCAVLSRLTDASKMYHSVRGQDVVKLSVIFNVLEIADRLCCSFGQDLLDSLFSRATLARRKDGRQPYLRPLGFFVLSTLYVLAHTLVLFYQLVTLNVAINSYDNALLTLLLSNQFVEIKGSVFKKFEKENVFQMTCADIVERFQLFLMLTAIGLRNLIELSGGATEAAGSSPLPASFTVFPSISLLETVVTPLAIVLASECFVDWLKHAFITKFNHIRPAVYGRFMDVLCRDLVVGGPNGRSRKHTFVDQSPIVSRRLGFAALPLACLLVRITGQVLDMIGDTSHIDECAVPPGLWGATTAGGRNVTTASGKGGLVGSAAGWVSLHLDGETVRRLDLVVRASTWTLTLIIAWAFLIAVKLLLGAYLVSYASHRYATMHRREKEEALNAKERAPIGVDGDELSYDKKLTTLVDRRDDDAIQMHLDGRPIQPSSAGGGEKGQGGGKKSSGSLMDVSRYTMVRSRIW